MKKLSLIGSSLVEVLSGISLLSLVLGMGLMLFQQLNGPFSANEMAKAQILCRNELYVAPSVMEVGQGIQRKEIAGYQIEREVRWWDPAAGICELRVRCKKQEHSLDQRVRLSRLKPEL